MLCRLSYVGTWRKLYQNHFAGQDGRILVITHKCQSGQKRILCVSKDAILRPCHPGDRSESRPDGLRRELSRTARRDSSLA
jgi:hypothetical protein